MFYTPYILFFLVFLGLQQLCVTTDSTWLTTDNNNNNNNGMSCIFGAYTWSVATSFCTRVLLCTRRFVFSVHVFKRAMAEIGNTRSTNSRYRVPLEHTAVPQRLRTTSHWSKPRRIRTQPHVHRMHPIMAEQVLEMYPTRIQATRLWPDYLTTSPHAHTHA